MAPEVIQESRYDGKVSSRTPPQYRATKLFILAVLSINGFWHFTLGLGFLEFFSVSRIFLKKHFIPLGVKILHMEEKSYM
jgi:hypothetical protein